MLTEKNIRFKKKVYLVSCLAIFIIFGIVPAYAGTLNSLLISVLGIIISGITSLIVGLLDIVAKFFLEAMKYNIAAEMMGGGNGFFEGFNSFSEILRSLAVAIATIVIMWQLLNILVGPFVNSKQSQSVGGVITRALVFIPLTFVSQDLATIFIDFFQAIYTDFAAVNGEATFDGLSSVIPLDLADKLGLSIGGGIDASLTEVAGVLLSGLFIAGIAWQFIKLLLEMAQRMVVMVVYAYLSPLAVACGVGANTINIAKQALSTFFSSGILWILNVWCLQGAIIMFNKCPVNNGATATPGEFFSWVVLTYALLKIIQQVDDIFNAVGASNVRFSGSIIDDLLSMRQISAAIGGTIGGIKNAYSGIHNKMSKYAEGGLLGAAAGRSSENPAGPKESKGINGFMKKTADEVAKYQEKKATATATSATTATTAFASANGIKTPNIQKTPKNNAGTTKLGTAAMYTRAAGLTLGRSTLAGKAISGMRKDRENIETIAGNIKENANTLKGNKAQVAINRALNAPTPEAKAEAFKRLAAEHPDYLHHDAAKAYLGEAMGLSSNQKVVGMSVNSDGELSARVATTEADKTILSSVNLSNKDWNQPSVRPETVGSASSTESFSADDVKVSQIYPAKAQSLGGDADVATVQFPSDKFNGCVISEPQDIEGSDLGKYRIKNAAGEEHFVTAPKGVTDEEIMSVVSGNAPQAVQDKFTAAGVDLNQYDAVRAEMGITAGEGVSATITKMPESSVPNQNQFKIETSDGQSFIVEGSHDAKAEDMAEFISTTDFRSDMERHFASNGVDMAKLDDVREKIGVDDYVTGIITSPTTERVKFEDAIRQNEDGTVDFAVAGAATNGEPVGVKLSEGEIYNVPGSDFDGLKKVHLSTTTGERQEHYIPPDLSVNEFAAMIMGEGTPEMENKFREMGKSSDMSVINSRGIVFPEEDWRHDRGNNTVFAKVDTVPDIPTYEEVGQIREIQNKMDSGIAGSTEAKAVFEAADGTVIGTLERSDSPTSEGFTAWKFTSEGKTVSEFEVETGASARVIASDFLHENSDVYAKAGNGVNNIKDAEYVHFKSAEDPIVGTPATDGSVWSNENIISNNSRSIDEPIIETHTTENRSWDNDDAIGSTRASASVEESVIETRTIENRSLNEDRVIINNAGPKVEVINDTSAPKITVESKPDTSSNKDGHYEYKNADIDDKYQGVDTRPNRQPQPYQSRYDNSDPIQNFDEQKKDVTDNKNKKRNKLKKRFNGNSKNNPAKPQ